jgi:hypothetical protein
LFDSGSEVVHPVGDGNRLGIGQCFGGFLNSRVQISDIDIGVDHGFAVQLQDNAQHAVRRWVLRAHVQDHRFCGTGSGLYGCHGWISPILFSAGPKKILR